MFAFLLNPGYNICLGLIEQNLCRDISKDEKIILVRALMPEGDLDRGK